jgi:Tat protein secretion system quality control protein TatD with DNase activity
MAVCDSGLSSDSCLDEEFNLADYQKLIDGNQRVVGVGECGFDYFYLKGLLKVWQKLKQNKPKYF